MNDSVWLDAWCTLMYMMCIDVLYISPKHRSSEKLVIGNPPSCASHLAAANLAVGRSDKVPKLSEPFWYMYWHNQDVENLIYVKNVLKIHITMNYYMLVFFLHVHVIKSMPKYWDMAPHAPRRLSHTGNWFAAVQLAIPSAKRSWTFFLRDQSGTMIGLDLSTFKKCIIIYYHLSMFHPGSFIPMLSHHLPSPLATSNAYSWISTRHRRKSHDRSTPKATLARARKD